MIYVIIWSQPTTPEEFNNTNKFIDFLELEVGLDPEEGEVAFMPDRSNIRVTLTLKSKLIEIEHGILEYFKHSIEWEIIDNKSNKREIRQLIFQGKDKSIDIIPLKIIKPKTHVTQL